MKKQAKKPAKVFQFTQVVETEVEAEFTLKEIADKLDVEDMFELFKLALPDIRKEHTKSETLKEICFFLCDLFNVDTQPLMEAEIKEALKKFVRKYHPEISEPPNA